MVQGYAIYLRTHRETGKQYAGCVWGTKLDWTPEKGCKRRWADENRNGICGFSDGFDSEIVFSERRADAPEMSDGFYHIRIAVDEAKAMEAIPEDRRLNKISPLIQLHPNWLDETIRAQGRKKSGQISKESGHMHRLGLRYWKIAAERGHFSEQGRKNAEKPGYMATIGKLSNLQDKTFAGKMAVANKKKNGIALFPRGACAKGGMIQGPVTGARMKKEGRGIFAQTAEQFKAAQVLGRHLRWHVRRNIVNPICNLCVSRG